MELSLDGLQSRFPRRTVTAVLQCAGNQRADTLAVKPVPSNTARSATLSGRAYRSATCRGPLVKDGPALHVTFDSHNEITEGGKRFRFGVAHQQPADRHLLAGVIPECGARDDVELALAVPIPVYDRHPLPGGVRIGWALEQRRLAWA